MTRHQFSVPCSDGTLLYHTMTCELVLLEGGETVEDCREALVRSRFLVPVDFDENKQVRDLRAVGTMLLPKKPRKKSFTVLTTTDCNARCFYCYEMGCKRTTMSAQTAHDVAAYIIKEGEGKAVSLQWFGGEPLYNREAIEIITADLRARGVEYCSRMVSNGYYLNEETVRLAKEDWNLERVQITLDGTREVYNRTKAYINHDPNAFERVLDNIALTLQAGIAVNIRLNLGENNAEDLSRLIDLLAARFGGQKGLQVYLALIKDFKGRELTGDGNEEFFLEVKSLFKKLDAFGWGEANSLLREFPVNRCMANNDACEVILPDGSLDKCEHFSETDHIGSIFSTEQDEALIRKWKEYEYFPVCEECEIYPQCINLKRCDWSKDGCPDINRKIGRLKLEKRILTAYEIAKKNSEAATCN